MSKPKTKAPASFWNIGKAYFIRTVTYHLVGRLVRMEGDLAILRECAWVSDSGRWNEAIKSGRLNEVEPFPPDMEVAVNITAMCDACAWNHSLPLGVL